MQSDKTLLNQMLIYSITFTFMIFLRKRFQVRVLRDIDGGNGGGGDPAG